MLPKNAIFIFIVTSACVEQEDLRSYRAEPVQNFNATKSAEFKFQSSEELTKRELFSVLNTVQGQVIEHVVAYAQRTDTYTLEKAPYTITDSTSKNIIENITPVEENGALVLSLADIPVENSVQLTQNNQVIVPDNIQGTKVILKDTLTSTDPIKVEYKIINPNIDLKVVADPSSIQVTVDGASLASNEYTLTNGISLELKNLSTPDQTITVSFRANEVQSVFAVIEPKPDTVMQVTLQDGSIPSFSYNSDQKEVTISPVLPEGSVVKISYSSLVGKTLIYPLTTQAINPDNITVTDFFNNEPIPFSLENNSIKLTEDKVRDGGTMLVKYKDNLSISAGFELANEPIASSLKTNFENVQCISGNGINFDKANVEINCETNSSYDLEIEYQYISKRTFLKATGVQNPDKGFWEVYYGGKKVSDWKRTGNTIYLSDSLEPDIEIIIRHYEVSGSSKL